MSDVETSDRWQDFTDLKRTLKALGDVVRLNIVHVLARGSEVNVTDLAQLLLISQPLVSWHLAILRRAGLVRTRRAGRQVYCSLDAERCRHYVRELADLTGCAENLALPGLANGLATERPGTASARN